MLAIYPRVMNPDWLIPLLFFPAFVGLWCGVCFLIALIGGWRALAKKYAHGVESFQGNRWHMQSGTMRGLARYRGTLTLGADARGLYLGVMVLFRAGHPPLFVPWNEIELRERHGWLFPTVDVMFTAMPGERLTVSRGLGEQLARAAGRPLVGTQG